MRRGLGADLPSLERHLELWEVAEADRGSPRGSLRDRLVAVTRRNLVDVQHVTGAGNMSPNVRVEQRRPAP